MKIHNNGKNTADSVFKPLNTPKGVLNATKRPNPGTKAMRPMDVSKLNNGKGR